MKNTAEGLEQAAVAMLRTLGAVKACLLVPQPAASSEQTGLGLAVPVVNEVELEPVLLQTTFSGASLLALVTRSTLKKALSAAGAVDEIATLEGSMLRSSGKQYRITSVTVKQFASVELIYELKIED